MLCRADLSWQQPELALWQGNKLTSEFDLSMLETRQVQATSGSWCQSIKSNDKQREKQIHSKMGKKCAHQLPLYASQSRWNTAVDTIVHPCLSCMRTVFLLQVYYSSKDGSQIPILIVGTADTPLDGNCPTVLSGYGGAFSM